MTAVHRLKAPARLADIVVEPYTPSIGATVRGIDLAAPRDAEIESVLRGALRRHRVLFFRDQQMSVDQHKAFGRLFGDLLVHPAARAEVAGHPEIRVVHADENTKAATGEGRRACHRPFWRGGWL